MGKRIVLCVVLSSNVLLGLFSIAAAESLVVSGSFSVSTSTSFQSGTGKFLGGTSIFSVPGFDTAWGTLTSVEKNFFATYSYSMQADGSGIGIPWGSCITMGFLSPSFATNDPIDFIARIRDEISTKGHNCYNSSPPDFQNFPGEIRPLSGSIQPGVLALLPQFQPETLLDFNRSGNVPIQAWMTTGTQIIGINTLPGSASGTFHVKYNFIPDPNFVKPPLDIVYDPTIQGGLGDQILLGSAGDDPFLEDLKKYKGQSCDEANKLQDLGDPLDTIIPIDPTDIESPVEQALNFIIGVGRASTQLFTEYFKVGAKAALRGGEFVQRKTCNDPPDPNFQEIVQRNDADVDAQFASTFGAQYSHVDEAFKNFGNGIESWDLFVTTLERMQGAILANDMQAFAAQKERAIELLTEGETYFLQSSVDFFDSAKHFSSSHSDLVPLALQLSRASSELTFSYFINVLKTNVTVPEMVCMGPMAPFNEPLVFKAKSNPTIPVKIVLKDSNGSVVTDLDITSPLLISVAFDSEVPLSNQNVVENLDTNGSANTDNQFRFDLSSEQWIYNLGTKQFPSPGTYTVQIHSGDETEYTFNGNCTQTFQRLP